MSAITAITAQNTLGVSSVHAVPPETILAQVRAVVSDIGVDAVKVGMLGTVETVMAVAQALDELPAGTPVVVDPVMVAESGSQLLDPSAQGALVGEILPRATILTPNVPEARALARHARANASFGGEAQSGASALREREASHTPSEEEEAETSALAHTVLGLGPMIVVLTGGHRMQATDLFLDSNDPQRIVAIPGEMHPSGAAHGSGCTHSSVLAAQLALGREPLQAAIAARSLAGEAVANGLGDVGEGPGPVDVIGLARLRLHHDTESR
jgi:hydroxymethylpyrimidine/phosphomethylpyrimidine kinase